MFRLGHGASGANFVVTSDALKMSKTVKQHTTHMMTHVPVRMLASISV